MSAHKVVIIGSGGLGRETAWAVRSHNAAGREPRLELLGFLTNVREQHGKEICGLPVLGAEEWVVGRGDVGAVCAIGDPRARLGLVAALEAEGVQFASVVHGSAEMSDYVELGRGCLVGAGALLTTQVSIGAHAVIGVRTIVSHDCVLEDFATLAPGVVLAGHARVDYGAELGAGATVVPRACVGRGAIVGAQAVVTADVEPNVVAVGIPARRIRRLSEDQWL